MERKYSIVAACVLVFVLGSMYWFGSLRSGEMIGIVNSNILMEKYVMVKIEDPLEKELETLQTELDEKIANTAELPDEERIDAIQELKDEYQSQLDERKEFLINERVEQIRLAIATVAQRKKIDTVIDNSYEMVLYGATDLTEEVLAELAS